jgi:hypothetical protein
VARQCGLKPVAGGANPKGGYMLFFCKHIAPNPSLEVKVHADSFEDAAQEFHLKNLTGAPIKCQDGSTAYYSIVDVSGQRFISRIFYKGIGRRGGVKVKENTIMDVAKALGVSVEILLEEDWLLEDDTWK